MPFIANIFRCFPPAKDLKLAPFGSVPNFFQTFLAFEYVSDDHLCIDCGIWALEQVV
jgi:hypothetical protein